MKANGGSGVQVLIQVMNFMKAPENWDFMDGPMPEVKEQIQNQNVEQKPRKP